MGNREALLALLGDRRGVKGQRRWGDETMLKGNVNR